MIVLTELAPVFQELKVQLMSMRRNRLMVRADERMLRLALLNLMRNGAEANPDGRVFVRAARENENVVIEVRDTGPGIPAGRSAKDLHSLLHD